MSGLHQKAARTGFGDAVLAEQIRLVLKQSLAVQYRAVLAAFPGHLVGGEEGFAAIDHGLLDALLANLEPVHTAHDPDRGSEYRSSPEFDYEEQSGVVGRAR